MVIASVAGRRVLLTGASSGIGRELAKDLAARGAHLVLAARRRPLLESLAEEIRSTGGQPPTAIDADLARPGAASELAEAAREALGDVDILINNAGGGVGGRIAAVGDREEGREAFEINYWSPLALIRSLAPAMLERGDGAIVNVTSMGQVSTWPGFGAYAATKAALSMATETLAMELDGTGVHVMEVLPGPVDTAVQGETRLAPGIERMLKRVPLGDAGEMARQIADGLERRRRRVIYPRRAAIGYVFPALVRWDGRRLARGARRELGEPEALRSLVVRTGSLGDDLTRQAREAWESSRGRG
ncbi:MAG TPA: SDR family NAD(P)-dependent oxidoreductase [Solirubrobacterales bacterium]|nr:SDR family NAD(P)-dependent oxidoreductase [Solirubrobacterales bacterium]